MNRQIIRIDPGMIGQMEGKPVLFPAIAYAGLEDGELRATWGLAWYLGRCWLWFANVDMAHTYPIYVLRNAKKMLRTAVQMGERAVFAWRDDHPTSAKLLQRVGFVYSGIEPVTFGDGSEGEREVWRWTPEGA